nr:hypothetical protein CFP56_11820 [Quercus suber]
MSFSREKGGEICTSSPLSLSPMAHPISLPSLSDCAHDLPRVSLVLHWPHFRLGFSRFQVILGSIPFWTCCLSTLFHDGRRRPVEITRCGTSHILLGPAPRGLQMGVSYCGAFSYGRGLEG